MSETINLTVEYWAQFRDAAGMHSENVAVPTGITLGSFLTHLAARSERLRSMLLDEKGSPRPSNLIMVDNNLTRDFAHAKLADHQTIVLMAPMAGG